MKMLIVTMGRRWLLAAALALLAYGCGSHDAGKQGTHPSVVKGTVTYRERMALPADAVVEVWMTDVTPGVITSQQVLGQTSVPADGKQVPIPFELPYDPAQIDQSHIYGMRAAINAGGEMLFTSDTPSLVITQGNASEVELWLKRPSPDPGGGAVNLTNTTWRLTDLAGTPALPDAEATLEFPETGKVAGHGSCNRFAGTVVLTGDKMQVGRLASTRMACAEAITVQEAKYLQSLQDAERFAIEGTDLVVYCAGMDKPLRFAPRSQ